MAVNFYWKQPFHNIYHLMLVKNKYVHTLSPQLASKQLEDKK